MVEPKQDKGDGTLSLWARGNPQETNILIGDILESEKELFFGPLTEHDKFTVLPVSATMWDVLVAAKIFNSKSDARKNWKRTDGVVPEGFTDLTDIGKLKRRITILKITP